MFRNEVLPWILSHSCIFGPEHCQGKTSLSFSSSNLNVKSVLPFFFRSWDEASLDIGMGTVLKHTSWRITHRKQKMKWWTVSFLLLQQIHPYIMKFRYCLIHVETWLFSVLHTRIHERHREWTKRNVRIFARAKKRAPPHTELTDMRGGMGSMYILSSLRLVLVQCVK